MTQQMYRRAILNTLCPEELEVSLQRYLKRYHREIWNTLQEKDVEAFELRVYQENGFISIGRFGVEFDLSMHIPWKIFKPEDFKLSRELNSKILEAEDLNKRLEELGYNTGNVSDEIIRQVVLEEVMKKVEGENYGRD